MLTTFFYSTIENSVTYLILFGAYIFYFAFEIILFLQAGADIESTTQISKFFLKCAIQMQFVLTLY